VCVPLAQALHGVFLVPPLSLNRPDQKDFTNKKVILSLFMHPRALHLVSGERRALPDLLMRHHPKRRTGFSIFNLSHKTYDCYETLTILPIALNI